MSKMRALTVEGPGRVVLQNRTVPGTPPGCVSIRPTVVGVCGTDIDIVEGTIDPAYVRYPLVLGHEWSGIVIHSAAPAGPAPGTRVVVEGILPCRRCSACASGDSNLCMNYEELGFVRDGAAADAITVPVDVVHALAPGVTAESGALVEPAAVVMRALMRANPQPGWRVLIIGDGTVGLLAARLARIWSPASVTLLGARSDQAGLAASAGVDSFHTDPMSAGRAFDLVVEAAGAPSAVAFALSAPRRGGRVVLLGLSGHGVTIPVAVDDLVNNDITVQGSFSYTSTAWAMVVSLLNAGTLDLGFLVTHRYPLEAWQEALDALRSAAGPRGKVLLDITPSDLS